MYYSLNKGLIEFSKYIININNIDDLNNIHIPLRINGKQIFCDTDNDLIITKNILKDIPYLVEDIILSEDIINKTKNIIYQNIEELQNHIENNIEPESVKKVKLQQENENLKVKLQQTEDVLLTLMFGGSS